MRNDCREAAMCVLFAEQFNEERLAREKLYQTEFIKNSISKKKKNWNLRTSC